MKGGGIRKEFNFCQLVHSLADPNLAGRASPMRPASEEATAKICKMRSYSLQAKPCHAKLRRVKLASDFSA